MLVDGAGDGAQQAMKKKKQEFVDRWLRLYKWLPMSKMASRPNCLKMLEYPSRISGRLYYPDGEVRDDYRRPD